jgi:preprotein translocase subunit YajC
MEIVILPIVLVVLFYFILLRPVINQQRQQRRDISDLEVGDEVLTTGGFYATVREIERREDGSMEILLEAAPGVSLRGTPGAIQQIVSRAADRAIAEAGGEERRG